MAFNAPHIHNKDDKIKILVFILGIIS
jgi:hypothetical protein